MMPGDWREARRSGMAAIAGATAVAAILWAAIYFLAPPLGGMESLSARMLVALRCFVLAVLFCLVTGVEAVAHERLRSPAFDPLAGYRTRRLEVNQRYLQNTLEQIVVFAAGLFGLAAYCADGAAMRVVPATAAVWVAGRLAFWAGYHRSAAMRGLGAPGMLAGMLALLYVAARVGYDVAGAVGAAGVLIAFGAFEALLFRGTQTPLPEGEREGPEPKAREGEGKDDSGPASPHPSAASRLPPSLLQGEGR